MTTFLFAPHIHRLAQPHRYLLVVTNGLRVVSLHIRRPDYSAPPYPCSSARGYRPVHRRGVFKPQLVKPASFIGLRPYRHLRLRPRQAPRRTVVLMVRPPHDYRLVRVPVQEVNNHLPAHARYRRLPNPGPAHACDTQPSTNSPPLPGYTCPSETSPVPGHVRRRRFPLPQDR